MFITWLYALYAINQTFFIANCFFFMLKVFPSGFAVSLTKLPLIFPSASTAHGLNGLNLLHAAL